MALPKRPARSPAENLPSENAVKSGMAYMVIVAEDASDNTRKKMSEYVPVTTKCPFICLGQKKNWDIVSEKNIAPCLQSWMRVLRNLLKNMECENRMTTVSDKGGTSMAKNTEYMNLQKKEKLDVQAKEILSHI